LTTIDISATLTNVKTKLDEPLERNAMYAIYLGSTPAVVRSEEDREAINRTDLVVATPVSHRVGETDRVADVLAGIRRALGWSAPVNGCSCPA